MCVRVGVVCVCGEKMLLFDDCKAVFAGVVEQVLNLLEGRYY